MAAITLSRRLAGAADTEALGGWLGTRIAPPLVIFLYGPLGAGKTTFCRGLLHALGHRGAVKSPTYTLCEHYTLPAGACLHCDFYRLSDPEEIEYLGIFEQLDEHSVLLVEWPELAEGVLPEPDIRVELTHAGAGREAVLRALTPHGRGALSHVT